MELDTLEERQITIALPTEVMVLNLIDSSHEYNA